MSTKPIDRLLFAQGGLCFFCNSKLPKAEATVEHLVPSARGGSNADENCVACCKAINTLLGSMSIKEKLRVVLNQKGNFKCPNGAGTKLPVPLPTPRAAAPTPTKEKATAKAPVKPTTTSPAKPTDPVSVLVANLKSRAKGRPAKLQTLTADIKSQNLGRNDAEVADLIEKLKEQGKIVVAGTKVTYKL